MYISVRLVQKRWIGKQTFYGKYCINKSLLGLGFF